MPDMLDLIVGGDLAGVQRAVKDDPALLDATVTTYGQTPLMLAPFGEPRARFAIAKWLIERGAKLDLRDNEGKTALMLACYKGYSDVTQLLIERGAKLDLQTEGGSTALMLACLNNHTDTARLLIERGAKLDLQTISGNTALMLACYKGYSDVTQLLIERGAKLDLQKNDGETALTIACLLKQPDVAQLLIERGAKLDLQNNDGETALIIACSNTLPDTAQMLVERGAKLDLQKCDGYTALMIACFDRQSDTAQLLIERGAKLDLQNKSGITTLMIACIIDRPAMAQLLIEGGAKLDLQNNDGDTALIFACRSELPATAAGSLRCVKLCYAAGAGLDLKNKNGRDALAVARYFNHGDAVAFLEFATASEVAGILLGELRQPRSLVVAFYEEDLLTKRDCSVLQDLDLEGMGVTSSLKRRRILREFIPNAHQIPRASLPRRASRRVMRAARRLSGIYQYDAFLTHDWGEDGANHELVRSVNARLRRADKVTWFDGERLSGDIVQQITQGIENSHKVVVFITERYMHKLRIGSNDFCKSEFMAAVRIHTPANMIAVVLESAMLNTSSWLGPLQFYLGGHLYIDFTTPAKREENFSFLLDRIDA